MSTIPWDQVREIVDEVLDLPPEERSRFLDHACPQPHIRRYVDSLVMSFEEAGKFLQVPAVAADPDAIAPGEEDSWKGKRVGPYQLTDEIGEGGMGSVYRALRVDDQYQKQVAVKVVRSGFDPRFAQTRFRAERQILANLEHPNIARLLDGGSTEDGQPYFVMEYIQGLPLDQYCDDHKLPITERLRLFRTVCSAVQYAHQNLVIHRDIKPGNILVTADGVPKLLDFGIAKILSADATGAAAETSPMLRLFTPSYASPEQLLDEPITTASDVYSLGVVLYELLAGRRPYRINTRRPEEIIRVVTGTEPERPSVAFARKESPSDDTPEAVSDKREGSPDKLRRRLAGDLDTIVLTALRKEPARRYVSVENFSEDIRRHLAGLPVSARRDTFAYRSGKFVRRHMAGVVAAAMVLVSLTAGLIVSIREARIARTQGARAERRFNDVRALANSLVFDIHDSIRDLPGSTEARQLLVTNALKYLDSLAQEAQGDRSLQSELADAYERVGAVQGQPFTASLGDTAGALQSYLKAQAIRQTLATDKLPANQIKEAANYRIVAELQLQRSDAAAAIKSAQEAVSIMKRLLDKEPADQGALAELAADYANLGTLLDEAGGSEALAEESFRSALEINEKLATGSNDRKRLRSLAVDEYHIGRHLRDAGYRTEALDAFNKALPILERLADSPNNTQAQRDLATITINLGDTYQMNGDAVQALANYQKGLAAMTAVSSADPNNGDARFAIGEAHLDIGDALVKLGKSGEAREHYVRAIAILEKALAADPKREEINYDVALVYVWLASITANQETALDDYQKALAINQKLAQVDTGTADWLEGEAEVHVKMGDFFLKNGLVENAAENYRKAAAIAEPIVASQPDRQEARYALSTAYFGLGEVSVQRAQRSLTADKQETNWKEAKSWYQRSADAWQQIRHPAAVSPNGFNAGNPEDASRGLARSNAALTAFQK
ncbi:MAG TPA: protein kinase [Terriglobales bacterium]|nr:protein kinase [Terriglobales bacterium]